MNRRRYLQAVGVGGVLSLAGCSTDSPADPSGAGGETLTLATATTTHDSGLLDHVIPGFEQSFGAQVEAVVRGTSGALRTGEDGDCDVVLVHARSLENEFLRDGYGINRRTVMMNDFLVVGPEDDPAGIAGEDPVAAFEALAETEATFLSRGDGSGTHVREQQLWSEAGLTPGGAWYSETGQGMGNTLTAAAQTDAYTLTDRGTFLNVAGETVVAHVDRGIEQPPPLLRNEYAIIPVNPARHDISYPLAMAFVGYLTGPAQDDIEAFRVAGSQAFRPVGQSQDPSFRQYVPEEERQTPELVGPDQ